MAAQVIEFPLSAREHAEKIWREQSDLVKEFLEEVGKGLRGNFNRFEGEFKVVWEHIDETISIHSCTLFFVERRRICSWKWVPLRKNVWHRVVQVELPFWSRMFGPGAINVACHVPEIVEDVRRVRDIFAQSHSDLPRLSIL